jgi:hypothetical protein
VLSIPFKQKSSSWNVVLAIASLHRTLQMAIDSLFADKIPLAKQLKLKEHVQGTKIALHMTESDQMGKVPQKSRGQRLVNRKVHHPRATEVMREPQ